MAVLDLRFCARAFSSCGKWGPLFITVRGPLTIVASLIAEHRLQTCRLSSCGSRAHLLHGMWDLPRPGLEPVSPALAGRLPTTAPPGKPSVNVLMTMENTNVVKPCLILLPNTLSPGCYMLPVFFYKELEHCCQLLQKAMGRGRGVQSLLDWKF